MGMMFHRATFFVSVVFSEANAQNFGSNVGEDDWWTNVHKFQTDQFRLMDVNGDGDVTSAELAETVTKLKARASASGVDMKKKDANGQPAAWEGFEQLESALVQKTDVNQQGGRGPEDWYKEHTKDKNGDGKWTMDEYLLDKNK